MIGVPSTMTLKWAGTTTLTSPMIALALIVVSWLERVASRRSMSTSPSSAKAAWVGGTCQAPLRLQSPRIAVELA